MNSLKQLLMHCRPPYGSYSILWPLSSNLLIWIIIVFHFMRKIETFAGARVKFFCVNWYNCWRKGPAHVGSRNCSTLSFVLKFLRRRIPNSGQSRNLFTLSNCFIYLSNFRIQLHYLRIFLICHDTSRRFLLIDDLRILLTLLRFISNTQMPWNWLFVK